MNDGVWISITAESTSDGFDLEVLNSGDGPAFEVLLSVWTLAAITSMTR